MFRTLKTVIESILWVHEGTSHVLTTKMNDIYLPIVLDQFVTVTKRSLRRLGFGDPATGLYGRRRQRESVYWF